MSKPTDGMILLVTRPRGEAIYAGISNFKGKNYFNLRLFFTDENSGDHLPTVKGISVPMEQMKTFKENLLNLLNDLEDEPAF